MTARPLVSWAPLRFDAGVLHLLDQRLLPEREVWLEISTVEAVAEAIESLVVRGAPAIGCTAAFGIVIAAQASTAPDVAGLCKAVATASDRLARTRPTAVNLFWALGRMREHLDTAARDAAGDLARVRDRLERAAQQILAEDAAACRRLGDHGAALVPDGARILTHCNAGALATGGWGTALGVVRSAVLAGRRVSVIADETRPFLQGARLTAWELARDAIPVSVATDNMAAHLMRAGEVDLVVVGADRIAANGDVANKIGTYGVALHAREHGLPFYVAAPLSTIDPRTETGEGIPIEERGRAEVAELGGRTVVPEGVPVRHPAFDVTPAALVTAIVTEHGVARPPYRESLAAQLRNADAEREEIDPPA